MKESIVPEGISMMECLVVHEVLQRVRARVLAGAPSGKVIDQAIAEAVDVGVSPSSRERSTAQSPRW